MKIAIVLGHAFPVPPVKGGAIESRAWELAGEFCRKGHEVVVYSVHSEGLSFEERFGRDLLVRRYAAGGWTGSRFVNLFRSFLWARTISRHLPEDVDIFLSNSLFLPYLRKVRMRRVPIFVGLHREPKRNFCAVISVLRSMGRVGELKFIAVSEFVAQKFKRNVSGVEDGVFVINNPVDLSVYCRSAVSGPVRGRILYAGRIVREKGLGFLLDAVGVLKRRGVDVSLRVVGGLSAEDGSDPKFLEELESVIERNGISDIVEFVGFLRSRDLVEEYRSATVFAYPSIGGEAWGCSVVEAMACGCPVVTSDFGPFREVFSSGVHGFHAKAGDSISLADRLGDILCNEALRASMSMNASERAKEFSLADIADLHLDAFAAAVSSAS